MAIIIDPDSLSQGAIATPTDVIFATGTGSDIRIHSGTNNYLPALADGEFFEVRGHTTLVNNGLYYVETVTTSTDDYECNKVTSGTPVVDAGEAGVSILGATGAANEKSVHIDTDAQKVYLFEQGNIGTVTDATDGGVTMLALHSFLKEEWKDDGTLDMHPFPMIGIDFDAGKWEFGTDPSGNFSDWVLADDYDDATAVINTKQLIRNAGWTEYDADGIALAKYFNVTTLGDFNNTTDQAYYAFGNDPTDTAAATDFVYANKVNEPVKYYTNVTPADPTATGDDINFTANNTIERTTGSFVTDGFIVGGAITIIGATTSGNDGTFTLTAVGTTSMTISTTPWTIEDFASTTRLAVDNSVAFNCFLREGHGGTYGNKFAQANLDSAGETAIVNKVIKFPLSTSDDLDITNTDGTIAGAPYNSIVIKYFDQAFTREVDSGGNRSFGVVIDVGTHSGVDGSAPGAASVLTTAEGGMVVDAFIGGTLTIHEGTDIGESFPITDNDATTITVTGTIASGSNLSFTAQLATPIVATKNEIYEKVQYLLRQTTDVDDTDQTISGKTTGGLLTFVGPDLIAGLDGSTNPNGGGSGVIIEGFKSADSTFLSFYDNGAVVREYPYVAAGTMAFNANLVNDSDPYYWLYYQYTKLTAATNVDMTSVSGSIGTITDDTATTLPNLAVDDYIEISGFADSANNGIFIVTAETVESKTYDVRKLNGDTLVEDVTGTSINVYEHPFGSDGAIVVGDYDDNPIEGVIGASSIAFDYDFVNNADGGRAASSNMYVRLVAIGLETGQYAISAADTFQITQSTSMSFSITSSLERNYDT